MSLPGEGRMASALSLLSVINRSVIFDRAKTSVLVYFVGIRLLKACRHVLARGFLTTLNEGRMYISRVSIYLRLRRCLFPSEPRSEWHPSQLQT